MLPAGLATSGPARQRPHGMMISALLVSVAATLVLDRITKLLAMSRLAEARFLALAGSAGLRRRLNVRPGFIPIPCRAALLLWVAAVAGAALLVAESSALPLAGIVALGAVLGGAGGNLWDRLAHGGVIDFIAIGRFPAFNLADAAMVCGTAAAAWSLA